MTRRHRICANAKRIAQPVMYVGRMAVDAEQATRIIGAAGQDEGNRRMRAAGRTAWNLADYNAAVRTANQLFRSVGLAP